MASNWISVNDRLPDSFVECFLAIPYSVVQGYYDRNLGIFRDSEEHKLLEPVTHWQVIEIPPHPLTEG